MTNPFTPLVTKLALIGAVLLAFGALFWWGDSWRDTAKDHAAAHEKTKANVKQAMAEATAKAWQAASEIEQRNNAQRRKSDEALELAQADARTRTDRYVAANRVPDKAAGCPTGRADLPSPAEPAQSPDRSGDAADMVAVTAADLNICTINSTRLVEAKAWAETVEP